MYRSRTVRAVAAVALLGACAPDYKLDRAAARVVVSPGLLDVGSVAVGATASAELTLTSVAGGAVTVVAVDVLAVEGGGFHVDGPLPVVPAEGTATVTVTFSPEDTGWHVAHLSITTDEPRDNVHVIDVRGAAGLAAAEVWPGVLDFGPVAAGATATADLTVANTGEIDLSVGSGILEGGPFALVSATPVDLPAGETADLTVRFAPTDDALATGTLTFLLDAVTLPPVVLRGNACGVGPASLYDADGDGYTACATDCADADASRHPGAGEICDGADDDCDGTVDEGTSCVDDDGDGVSEDEGDCNDGDANVSSATAETWGNGVDDDCDGVIDAGTEDADGDGYAAEAGDCDPAKANV
ncbi:MAG: choice-of-anchor D domain-containing protein, partial [Myxococcota bacterium]